MSSIINARYRIPITVWLAVCIALVALMVLIGGYTRLSGSGLSITEWKPIHGALPPMNQAAWIEEFESYKKIPQYQAINRGMCLEEFKAIYWPEFWHRNLGRLIGLVFFIPFALFAAKRAFSRSFALKLLGIFALGGFQGAIGWIMVASGLQDRIYVSHIKLALHLGTAFILFGLLIYAAMSVYYSHSAFRVAKEQNLDPARLQQQDDGFGRSSIIGFSCILLLLFVQILLGALMAGTHAGLLYPTFPLMDGHILPPETFTFQGAAIDNLPLIQFLHRYTAKILVLGFGFWWFLNRKSVKSSPSRDWWRVLVFVLCAQFVLGVLTLIKAVPLALALKHQMVGLVLFGLCVAWLHVLKRR